MRRLLALAWTVYAVTAFVLIALVLFGPLIVLWPTLAGRRALGRACVRSFLAAWFVPFTVRGREHLPAGACVVVSNHVSYLDGLAMMAALPGRFLFLVQDGAARWPYVGLILKRAEVVFVDRSSPRNAARQTRVLIRELEAGGCLTVFPEGTFRDTPGLLPFRNGAFLMAARTHSAVVPAVIRGTRQVFGGQPLRLRHGRVEIEFLPPLLPDGDDRDAAHRLRDAARAAIAPRCGEPDTQQH